MSHKKLLDRKIKPEGRLKAIAKTINLDKNCWKLGLVISLTVVCLSKSHRSAIATELNDGRKQNLFSDLNPDSNHLQSKFLLLSEIFQRLERSAINQKTHLTQVNSTADNNRKAGKIYLADERDFSKSSVPVAAVDSSTQKRSPSTYRIHIVKVGDTINRIAKQYGVSRDKLVELNQLENSNVIFVDRQLKIPPANNPTIAKKDSISQTKNAASPRNRKTDASTTIDPHLAKLKADIELLRQQYRNETKNKKANTPFNLPNKPVTSDRSKKPLQAKTRSTAVNKNKLATSSSSTSNLLPKNAIALTLPPLPPSEEYLPKAFEGYIWPAQGVLTSGYGYRWGRMHRGIDIAAPIGTPILAAAAGTVIDAGWHDGYGYLVKIEHLDGSVTVYAHNNRNLVTYGQKVQQGEQIAEMGNTGNSTGSHLHFEIITKDRKIVDPMAFLGGS